MPTAQLGDSLDIVGLMVFAMIATPVLVILAVILVATAGSRLMAIQRQQLEELVRLRHMVAEFRQQQPPADDEAAEVPRIGTAERVFQTGDRVQITDGVHRGDHGTVAATPDWVREGFVCVDLVGVRGQRYMAVSKLTRLAESNRK